MKITGCCGDVTRRKLTDLAILKQEKLAIAGRLSASIAHEVNNPLEAVTNLLYLLRSGTLDQQQRAYLDGYATGTKDLAGGKSDPQVLAFLKSQRRLHAL